MKLQKAGNMTIEEFLKKEEEKVLVTENKKQEALLSRTEKKRLYWKKRAEKEGLVEISYMDKDSHTLCYDYIPLDIANKYVAVNAGDSIYSTFCYIYDLRDHSLTPGKALFVNRDPEGKSDVSLSGVELDAFIEDWEKSVVGSFQTCRLWG